MFICFCVTFNFVGKAHEFELQYMLCMKCTHACSLRFTCVVHCNRGVPG